MWSCGGVSLDRFLFLDSSSGCRLEFCGESSFLPMCRKVRWGMCPWLRCWNSCDLITGRRGVIGAWGATSSCGLIFGSRNMLRSMGCCTQLSCILSCVEGTEVVRAGWKSGSLGAFSSGLITGRRLGRATWGPVGRLPRIFDMLCRLGRCAQSLEILTRF